MPPPTYPNFMIIGAMKSATTDLCQRLADHPQLFMSEPKEPDFFARDELYRNSRSAYEALFADAPGHTAIGEGSVNYTKRHLFPDAAQRVAQELPGIRLIFIARHPVDRITSHLMHNVRKHRQARLSVADALSRDTNPIQTSRYLYQLEPWLERFDRSRLKVLLYEHYAAERPAVLAECWTFLGLTPPEPAVLDADKPEPARVHTSIGDRFDRQWTRRVRQWPGVKPTLRLIPARLKRTIGSLTKQALNQRPRWDRAAYERVEDQLRDESDAFLDRFGFPRNAWAWNPPEDHSTPNPPTPPVAAPG